MIKNNNNEETSLNKSEYNRTLYLINADKNYLRSVSRYLYKDLFWKLVWQPYYKLRGDYNLSKYDL